MQLLKFYADWCQPCKIVARVMSEVTLPFDVVNVNLDDNIDTALKYGVRSVPTLLLLDDNGEVMRSHTGTISTQALTEFATT